MKPTKAMNIKHLATGSPFHIKSLEDFLFQLATVVVALVLTHTEVLVNTVHAQTPQGHFEIAFKNTTMGEIELFPPFNGTLTCRGASGSLANLYSNGITPPSQPLIVEFNQGSILPQIYLDFIPAELPYRCDLLPQTTTGGDNHVSSPLFIKGNDFDTYFGMPGDPAPPLRLPAIYYPVDTPVTFRVEDRLGNLISGPQFGLKAVLFDSTSNANIAPTFQKQGAIPNSGVLSNALLVNHFSYRYRLRPGPNALNPANGTGNPELPFSGVFTDQETSNSFYVRKDFQTFSLNSTSPNDPAPIISLVAEKAEAKVELRLFDSDLTTQVGGYFRIESDADPNVLGSFDVLVSGEFSATSSLSVPVISGRTYRVSVFPPQTQQGATDKIPPKPQIITIPFESISTFPLDFTLKEPNYLLTVNLSATNQTGSSLNLGSFSSISCSAYNARKEKSSAKVTPGESSVILPLYVKNENKAENWKVNCFGVESTTSNSNSRKYSGETSYQTIASQTGDSINLAISDSGTYYTLVSPTILLNQNTKLTFPDGQATIEFPSGGLSVGSGIGSVEINTATEFSSTLESLPLTVWEITPKIGGTAVTIPEKDAELCIPIDETELSAVGATTDAVLIARYDEDSEVWSPLATTITTDENGDPIACASIDHFSILGTIIDVALALQETTPSSLKLRLRSINSTRNRCVATWTAPETEFADVLSYTVRFKKFSKPNKRKKCKSLEDDAFVTKQVAGKTRATLKTKSSCCVEVLVEDGETPTTRKFKRPR